MKLTLHKHNLENSSIKWTPANIDLLSLAYFPKHIRDMARFAELVEYQDGDYKKVLKDRNHVTFNEGMPFSEYARIDSQGNLFVKNVIGQFNTIHINTDNQGITELVLKR